MNANVISSLNCGICKHMLSEPVTLPCGHTSCKNCLLHKQSCGCDFSQDLTNIKVNILVWTIVNKLRKNKEDNGISLIGECRCSVCFQVFLNPVTTSCGHTFCRECILRALDSSQSCPLCKTILIQGEVESKLATTKIMEEIVQSYFKTEFSKRERSHENLMRKLLFLEELPVMVCGVAFPAVSCPLKIFEPRYRLMLRRCIESGSNVFGMTLPKSGEERHTKHGTILMLENVEKLQNGDYLVKTIGWRRFEATKKSEKDGYGVVKFQFFCDTRICPEHILSVQKHLDTVKAEANDWFTTLSSKQKNRIIKWFGKMPATERNWQLLPDGPSWMWWLIAILPLNRSIQYDLVRSSCLQKRLLAVHHFLGILKKQRC